MERRRSISYRTKITGITQVVLVGTLESKPYGEYGSFNYLAVVDGDRVDNLEAILEAFEGKKICIQIELLSGEPPTIEGLQL